MKFGFTVPVNGPGANPQGIAEIAGAAESFGYSYIAVNDHVVVPRDIHSLYPYTDDGMWPGRTGDYLEPLSLIGFLSGVTKKIDLLTSILVIPYRPPILAAKMISSLDVMSDGRLILGIGAGWMREEFEAIGAPDFGARGKVTDEYIGAFRTLWREENPSFHGTYVEFKKIIFQPKPVQENGPRIWVGGEGRAARRRVANLGDGWYPVGNNPQAPLDTGAYPHTQFSGSWGLFYRNAQAWNYRRGTDYTSSGEQELLLSSTQKMDVPESSLLKSVNSQMPFCNPFQYIDIYSSKHFSPQPSYTLPS